MKIGIVGGGASGIAVFYALVKNLVNTGVNDIQIYIFEKTSKFGTGLAYNTTLPSDILNTPIEEMSLDINNKLDFKNWLLENKEKILELDKMLKVDGRPSRYIYSMYLQEKLFFYKTIAECNNIDVHLYLGNVIDITNNKINKMFSLSLSNKKIFLLDFIILAIGGLFPERLKLGADSSEYILSPYNFDDINRINKTPGNVCIIGTSLTAIDNILRIQSDIIAHNKKIYCLSNSGRFPCVRADDNKIQPTFIQKKIIDPIYKKNGQKLSINDVFTLIKSEISICDSYEGDFSFLINDELNEFDRLLIEIKKCERGTRNWQSVFYHTNDLLNYIWDLLDENSKNDLFYKYSSFFLKYRAAMPISSAKSIFNLINRGILHVKKMTSPIVYKDNKFICFWNNSEIKFNYLIDCRGLSHDIIKSNNQLLINLQKNNLITKNKFNGLRLAKNKINTVDNNNQPIINMYAVGYLTKGEFFITNLMEHCVNIANIISLEISRKISNLMNLSKGAA